MAAQASVVASLVSALASAGYAMLTADQAQIETAANSVSDDTANKILNTVVANINGKGFAAVIEAPLKTAIIASEPALDGIINQAEDALVTQIETALKNAAHIS